MKNKGKIDSPSSYDGVSNPLPKIKMDVYYIHERIVEKNYSMYNISKGEIQND